AEKEDYEIYDGNTLISGANDRWSNNDTVFSYKILTGNDSVTLTFKLVDNQTLEDAEETLTITLTDATATVNGTTQDIKIGTATTTTVNIKNDKLNVKWQTIAGTDASKASLSADPNAGGQRVFPEKATPNGVIENKFELVFELEVAATADTTLYYQILDPKNFIGLGNTANTDGPWQSDRDNYATLSSTTGSIVVATGTSSVALTVVVYPAGYTGTKLSGNATTIIIDSAHAGDNFIVVVDTDQAKVDAAALGETGDSRYKETSGLTQTEQLTVWRTLWIELDQMATPNMTIADGFDPAEQGITWDVVEGTPNPEPVNFDIFDQPSKPDISLLTTAMKAACIEIKEISQDAAHNSWITNDTTSVTPNTWDTTTTSFVHNLPDSDISTVTNIGQLSRDVNINLPEFWTVQAIGGYEAEVFKDYDASGASPTFGYRAAKYATANPIGGVIMIFQETIRDFAATGKNESNVSCKRTETELNRLVTFHETLHTLGFVDPANGNSPDGDIMNARSWLYTENIDHVVTLNAEQIQKIQARTDIQ
ncbi:MAG: hypothetical protein LBJ00_17920, partial [Planctomycetaceae bacterium]|nr:hypothetical protein [Planctomycetaceae bacterium]